MEASELVTYCKTWIALCPFKDLLLENCVTMVEGFTSVYGSYLMKERLFTILISVATTFGLMSGLMQQPRVLEVDRLIVREELIVSDTGEPWESGYAEQQIARGLYARSLFDGPGGLWVRSRLIKGEIDDPFDDRFHALESSGNRRGSPGHISWNMWAGDAWRQMAIIQGESLESSEIPDGDWNGGMHPGRLRFQTFRPGHDEPLTDAIIGQGKMAIGGGGFGGGGLPYPTQVLELWGGRLREHALTTPAPPTVLRDDGSGRHLYSVVAVAPDNSQSDPSVAITANGLAQLQWDSVPGADAYIVIRNGRPVTGAIRIEGSQKTWSDTSSY